MDNIPILFFINVDASFVQSILYTGVVSTVVCMLLWNIGIQKLGATTSGIFLNFNPIFTAIIAFTLLGEKITWIQVVGSVVVIVGSLLFTYVNNKPKYLITVPRFYRNKTTPIPLSSEQLKI